MSDLTANSGDGITKGRHVSGENDSEGIEPIAHHNVVVLTTRGVAEMDTIVASPALRGLIWRRLDSTHALVDPTAVMLIFERLESVGISASVGELPPAED